MTATTPMGPAAYSIDTLARAAGVSRRLVHFYTARGVLPPPVFRGAATAYDEDHLVRLLVARRLRAQKQPLDVIRRRLARATRDELEALAGITRTAPAGPPPGHLGPYRSERAVERWARVVLGPGVELHVREGADAEALRVATEVEQYYAARTRTPASGAG